jgi:hypothetical protein
MSGYVEAGYLIAIGSLGSYAVSLVSRERAARRRLPPAPVPRPDDPVADSSPVARAGRPST